MAKLEERPLVALVGAETLLAKEVRSVLEDLNPAPRIQLIATGPEDASILVATEEEPIVMAPLSKASLEDSKVAFLAGSAASSRRALKVNPEGLRLIDLAGGLEEQPSARLRAPTAELKPVDSKSPIQIVAHPAAIAMAMFLGRAAAVMPIRQSLVHVFEPASERGQKGLEELQQQTVGVLSFKKLKTDVFDTQIAFNMLARYGEEAVEPLEGVEQKVERHLASLLAAWPNISMPSLRVVQAPVFHGYSMSVWIEFEGTPNVKTMSAKFAEWGIDVRPDDPPNNAGIAGQNGLSIGAISVDRNNPRACWFWVVVDNLRLAAENAVKIAQEML